MVRRVTTESAEALLADLLRVLDLKESGSTHISIEAVPGTKSPDGAAVAPVSVEEATVFIGESQRMPHHRVFGGQVLAQSVVAAGRTVADLDGGPRPIHSLHGYFVRPGDDAEPIHYAVERMRDGRSFSTRRVHAIQHGKTILSLIASFQQPAGGLDHLEPMPKVPGPDGLMSAGDALADSDQPTSQQAVRPRPIELRHVEGNLFTGPGPERVNHQSVWMRAVGKLPDDPLIHAAVLAYASDYSLLESVLRRHGIGWRDPRLRVASLDHALWFHRPVRVDEWLLYSQESPSAQGGRGLGIGRIYAQDSTLVATVAQEGMLRISGL